MFGGGPHTIRFHPAEEGQGFVFYRNGKRVPATLATAYNARFGPLSCTAVENEELTVRKVEHILSAAYGIGIDDLTIEVAGGICPRFPHGMSTIVEALWEVRAEVPRMAHQFLDLLSGYEPMDEFTVDHTLPGQERCVMRTGKPDRLEVRYDYHVPTARITYRAEFPHRAIGEQHEEFTLTPENYRAQIMAARGPVWLPFGWKGALELPFHGITEENSLLIGNRDEPEYRNQVPHPYGRQEFVRHKILDAVGDLALSGCRFRNTAFHYSRTGHGFNLHALRTLFARDALVEWQRFQLMLARRA